MKKQTKKLLNEWEVKQMAKEGNKFYQYERKIGNTNYVFQNPGKRMLIRMTDEATDKDGKRSNEKLMDLAFKNIIVSPDVNFEYFDDPEHEDEFDEVTEILGEFLAGNFRNLGKEDQE